MDQERLFSKKGLRRLIIPLIIEQTLTVTVGMADIIMVAAVGEAAVSGVSLVDTINILLVNIFSALATGGAVICAHYLGKKDQHKACQAANQLIVAVFSISMIVTLIAMIGNGGILHMIFGNVDAEVMSAAKIYFYLTAASYPFVAVYNGSAALCRSMGNSKISMNTSLIINLMNIIGNAIFIFGFGMGSAGVGLSTLVSRVVGGIIMLHIIRNQHLLLHIHPKLKLGFNLPLIKEILQIGVPNGLENSVFQLGKILVQSLIASFGTAAIAANAMANTIASLGVIPGSAIGLAMITVVGQSVGAGRPDEAKAYVKELLKVAHIAMLGLNLILGFLTPVIIQIYRLSPEASALGMKLAIFHCIFCIFIWPESFALPNALRAAKDVKYTMVISLISMWSCRIALSYYFGRSLGFGVIGVWMAMVADWSVRSCFFVYRVKSGGWIREKKRAGISIFKRLKKINV